MSVWVVNVNVMEKKNMLFEVLREEQEPFVLKDFIAETRRRKTRTNQLQLHFPSLSSPSSLTTTALVREDAARIHVHEKNKKKKAKGVTFFSLLSLLKQLVPKKRQRPKEICGDDGLTVNLDSPLPGNRMLLLRTSPEIAPDDHHQDSRPTPTSTSDTSPSASPARRRPERQLLCGARDVTDEEESGQNSVPNHCAQDNDQFSPVSVLDPPFQQQQQDEEEEDQTHCFEQSLAIVQRSRRQLLSKLRRFERLAAGLDPLDLDKTMAYSSNEDESLLIEEEEEDNDNLEEEWMMGDSLLNENKKLSPDMLKLVMDLMQEEEEEEEEEEKKGNESKSVEKRLEEWEDVEAKSIDVMVEMEMTRSGEEWKTQVLEVGGFVERDIFLFLTEELSNDLLN